MIKDKGLKNPKQLEGLYVSYIHGTTIPDLNAPRASRSKIQKKEDKPTDKKSIPQKNLNKPSKDT